MTITKTELQVKFNKVLKDHDVLGLKAFIKENPSEFKGLTDQQKDSDPYLFDLIHVYRAHLFLTNLPIYDYSDSLDYCVQQGFIKLDSQEGDQPCVITQESDQDKHQ